jgi:demethylmenaquinone methyltransferase/2-methoxy-6-polyprenyl-1,4-benzoquinol methylase
MSEDLLAGQVDYYRARAAEYDDWWLRRGAFDAGPEHTASWKAEIALLRRQLDRFDVSGCDVIELAGGTGNWTSYLARRAASLTVVDAAPETLAINRRKIAALPTACPVEYRVADLFRWRPERTYDVVFFSFWLSHVPDDLAGAFWAMVGDALRPAGRFFCIDSRFDPAIQGRGVSRGEYPDDATSVRRLSDGRAFTIVKVFREPDDLALQLSGRGWQVETGVTGSSFMWISGTPGARQP